MYIVLNNVVCRLPTIHITLISHIIILVRIMSITKLYAIKQFLSGHEDDFLTNDEKYIYKVADIAGVLYFVRIAQTN